MTAIICGEDDASTTGVPLTIAVGKTRLRSYGGNRQPRNQRIRDESSKDEHRQDNRHDYHRKPRNNRHYQRSREELAPRAEPVAPPIVEKGESSVHCFIFQQRRHYVTQCPRRDKGKGPSINTITAEVWQVTTLSKAKTTEWEEQDDFHKAAKAWVESYENDQNSALVELLNSLFEVSFVLLSLHFAVTIYKFIFCTSN